MNKWFAGCGNVKLFELHKNKILVRFCLLLLLGVSMNLSRVYLPTYFDELQYNLLNS